MDNIDRKVINIDYPCIQDIILRKDETDVCFTVSDGQDETKLFFNDEQDVMFTVNIGDVSNIGFGGTDNWGKDRLPIYISHNNGSYDYDSVFVDTIEIQEMADGWCKCELINNNKNVKYTALSENPYNTTRTAYFYHKTKDDTIKRGYNEGRPASNEWCVTIIQEANPNGKPSVNCNGETVGNDAFVSPSASSKKVEIGSWSKNSECTESWGVDTSRQVSGECFINLNSVEFRSDNKIYGSVSSANATSEKRYCRIPTKLGDFKDYFTIHQDAGITPPTPDTSETKDIGELKYKVGLISDIHMDVEDSHNSEYATDLINVLQYFRNNDIKFICNAGDICQYNDDDYKVFNDIYTNYAWAPTNTQLRLFTALGNHDYLRLYTNGSDISKLLPCFTNFTGEDLWQNYGYKEKTDYMQFFEYNGEWDKQYYGDRTVKSKLSYWFENNGDIYIFLSIDYGDDTGEVWDEQSRGYHLLDKNDKYVKQMIDYVSDTYYTNENGSFDYQFYNPNSLMWLKDILENNKDKKVFVFLHHFLPHKAGDSDGAYSHLRIWPYSNSKTVRQKFYYGSNTLCGLTFYFINKLNNTYKNSVWFSGHSHREWTNSISVCNNDYDVKKPNGTEVTPLVDNIDSLNNTEYDYRLYTRISETPIGKSGYWIGLPSLAKPIGYESLSTMYQASQGGILEVHENGIVLKEIYFKKNNSGYINETVREITINN